MSRLIDLSHDIRSGMTTYKGLPAPLVCDFLSREASRANYEGGTEFQIARIEMVANTGTYLDCPFHRYADGKDLAAVALERLVGLPALVVQVDHRERLEIGPADFASLDVRGKAVLVHTGWSRHWGTAAYLEDHPFLSAAAARQLREAGAALVGIDSHNIDDTRTRNSRPVHSELLAHEILIVEHLRGLELLPSRAALRFTAVPPRFVGVGTFPVRAFAELA
jgi:arylformamidase